MPHPYDKSNVNIYYFSPLVDKELFEILKQFPLRNTESVGTLLCEFFRYFATFDFENSVITINGSNVNSVCATIPKIDKAEHFTWPLNDNMSVEDPFETFYDVTHVIKGAQMAHIRLVINRWMDG